MTLGILLLSIGAVLALLIYVGVVGFGVDALALLVLPAFFLSTYGFFLASASILQPHHQVVQVVQLVWK